MIERTHPTVPSWRPTHGDLTDAEWALIADLVQPWWRPGEMGRPATVDRRRVVDAILYVAATGCQWRALPAVYPDWNTVRRRVQNDTMGHRGRKDDPLYRARRLLTIAHERLSPDRDDRLQGLLRAGDPRGEVRMAWHAKEVLRSIYDIDDAETAAVYVAQLGVDLQDDSCPPEVQRLGRTILRWQHRIAAWHRCRHTNGPTEAINNLVKRIKRVAFGMTNWTNYRTRALLYAGRPNWSLLNP